MHQTKYDTEHGWATQNKGSVNKSDEEVCHLWAKTALNGNSVWGTWRVENGWDKNIENNWKAQKICSAY